MNFLWTNHIVEMIILVYKQRYYIQIKTLKEESESIII
jgi:hypothetical protein